MKYLNKILLIFILSFILNAVSGGATDIDITDENLLTIDGINFRVVYEPIIITNNQNDYIDLINKGIVKVTAKSLVIENIIFFSNPSQLSGLPAIFISGQNGCNIQNITIRNIKIHHKNFEGIKFQYVENLIIEDVEIIFDGGPLTNEIYDGYYDKNGELILYSNRKNYYNIFGRDSNYINISNLKISQGLKGIYIFRSNYITMNNIESHNIRGYIYRNDYYEDTFDNDNEDSKNKIVNGHFIQLNQCEFVEIDGFSCENNPEVSATSDLVSLYSTWGVKVRNGFLNGNVHPSGSGIMFEDDLNNSPTDHSRYSDFMNGYGYINGKIPLGIVENVDVINCSGVSFAAYPSKFLLIKNFNTKDNICRSQGFGKTRARGLFFAANYTVINNGPEAYDSHDLELSESRWYNQDPDSEIIYTNFNGPQAVLFHPGGFINKPEGFYYMRPNSPGYLVEENFLPRDPIRINYLWNSINMKDIFYYINKVSLNDYVYFYWPWKTVADVNGDGKADFIAINQDDIYIVPGTSSCTFDNDMRIYNSDRPYFYWPWKTVADVNGDGKADFIAINQDDMYIVPGTSSCTFDNDMRTYNSDRPYFYWPWKTVADVNGDGKADFIAIDGNDMCIIPGNTISGTSKGFFDDNQKKYLLDRVYFYWPWKTVADVNGDGKADFIAINQDDIYIVPGTSSGIFDNNMRIYITEKEFLTWPNKYFGNVTGDDAYDLIAFCNKMMIVVPGRINGSLDFNNIQVIGINNIDNFQHPWKEIKNVNGTGYDELISIDMDDAYIIPGF